MRSSTAPAGRTVGFGSSSLDPENFRIHLLVPDTLSSWLLQRLPALAAQTALSRSVECAKFRELRQADFLAQDKEKPQAVRTANIVAARGEPRDDTRFVGCVLTLS